MLYHTLNNNFQACVGEIIHAFRIDEERIKKLGNRTEELSKMNLKNGSWKYKKKRCRVGRWTGLTLASGCWRAEAEEWRWASSYIALHFILVGRYAGPPTVGSKCSIHRAGFTYLWNYFVRHETSTWKQCARLKPGRGWLGKFALPPFHDGFLWSSLDSEFCRQVENHCPACHPSCTFTVLSNSTSERLLPQHKGVHNPSVSSGLWCSSAKDADVYSYLWFWEGLFCTEHSLLAKKKFSMLL